MTTTDILKRCCDSPCDHLAEPSFSQFQAYSFGYELHTALKNEDFDNDAFTAAVKEDYGVQGSWPFNVVTTGFLVAAEGKKGALPKYLEYRERLAKPTDEQRESRAAHDLLEILSSKDSIRKRPGMYLGNDAAASHMWSLISGCRWAEIYETGEPGKACAFQIQFQSWVEERFPFSRGIPWCRTFYFVSLSCSDRSLKTFFDHFDLFRSGERPDCLSQTARIMMNSIAEKCGCAPSGMEDTIKQIAPI